MSDNHPIAHLRRHTHARIGLGRAGDGLPTREVLDLSLAHARARDAVHRSVDFDRLAAALAAHDPVRVRSAAADRVTYLRRPDLGRTLAPDCAAGLPEGPFDVVFVIADGLSSAAVDRYAAEVLRATVAEIAGMSVAPAVLVEQGRVAVGDDIGFRMRARMVVVLIGERPGLSSPASLGAYVTFGPVPGTPDSGRNCVSNIHDRGLAPDLAAATIGWLIREGTRLRTTGVALKIDAPGPAVSLTAPQPG